MAHGPLVRLDLWMALGQGPLLPLGLQGPRRMTILFYMLMVTIIFTLLFGWTD